MRLTDKAHFLSTNLLSQFLRIATTVVMARALTPDDYGLVTLANSSAAIISSLGDLGMGRALVQFGNESVEAVEDTALVISIILGTASFLASITTGLVLAQHYQRSDMLPIGLIIGVTLFLNSLYLYYMNCLNRDLQFAAESRQNLIAATATASTGIVLALAGWGAYALVLQTLVAQIIANIAIHRHRSFRLPRQATWMTGRQLLTYGFKVTLAQYVNNLQQSMVNFSIAATCGSTMLGVFARASQVRDLAGQNLVSSADRLIYPLMRHARDTPDRTRTMFKRGLVAVSLLCTFAWAWLSVNSAPVVTLVLGTRWQAVSPVLSVLSLALLTGGLGLMCTVVAHALGRPLTWMWYSMLGVLGLSTTLLVGGWYGIIGVAWVTVVVQLATTLAFARWAIIAIRLPLIELVQNTGPVYVAALVSYFAMAAANPFLARLGSFLFTSDSLRSGFVLLVTSSVGLSAIVATTYAVRASIIHDLKALVLTASARDVAPAA